MQPSRAGDHTPALEAGLADTTEVHRHPTAWHYPLHLLFVSLEAADSGFCSLRHYLDFLSHLKVTIGEGAGDDGTKATDGEYPINGQPWSAKITTWFDLTDHPL